MSGHAIVCFHNEVLFGLHAVAAAVIVRSSLVVPKCVLSQRHYVRPCFSWSLCKAPLGIS
jgi:hypothetical protein